MARSKKAAEETNLKEIPLEDLALEEIEELPAMPEIPIQEPSIEEQIKMATDELERRNSITPWITYELLVSPGWTLPVNITACLRAKTSKESLKSVITNMFIVVPFALLPIFSNRRIELYNEERVKRNFDKCVLVYG